MLLQMADGHVATPEKAAERALEELREMGSDLREAAILDADGEVLAATTDAEWKARAEELWAAADEGDADPPTQIHVATDAGEVFAVRAPGGVSAIAVTPRFALESLMFCDLRAALRGLRSTTAVPA